ncbi:zinc ribbon domain-containing protein [Ureibacillus manganicus]|uniref:DZANK-type domain-containing protein n=1 Tax=Ureibacillus manganicus DSM 26584 TaxID=1384049 RepID=A0A0A3I481_9BACL|nr:zinc ribbon domain-containing protein [Ureibacillus manganicus]KGR79611.1 hypothetical protein CD29_05795 [Ureibacillus manganicus DSM 26584]
MIDSIEQRVPELQELKQQLNLAKEQRINLVIKLGEITLGQLRIDEVDISLLKNISDEIIHKDVIIYQTQNAITKFAAQLHHCPNCQQQVEESAKFCGNCGTLNPYFIDPNAQQVICNTCEQLIEAQHMYCPCCGVIQEGN